MGQGRLGAETEESPPLRQTQTAQGLEGLCLGDEEEGSFAKGARGGIPGSHLVIRFLNNHSNNSQITSVIAVLGCEIDSVNRAMLPFFWESYTIKVLLKGSELIT